MGTKKMSGALESVSLQSYVRSAVGIFLALLILGGVGHATPIMDVGDSGAQTAAAAGAVKSTQAAAVAALESAQTGTATTFYTLNVTNWTAAASGNTCTLSGDCRTTTKIPEPQSLMLVGSGLLSMAGFIRRRLAR